MPNIRIIAAAAATAAALACMFAPAASARPCDDGNEACISQQASPMKLDQFMRTWKPAAASRKHAKKPSAAKAAPEPAVRQAAEPATTQATTPNEAVDAPDIGVASNPEKTIETDGVAVASFDDLNEVDAAANKVQVVASNEINEIDLAAPPAPPAPSIETTGQSVASADPLPVDNSWIGKLLLAIAGTIAAATATRLLIA
jgi:hypothetical protein